MVRAEEEEEEEEAAGKGEENKDGVEEAPRRRESDEEKIPTDGVSGAGNASGGKPKRWQAEEVAGLVEAKVKVVVVITRTGRATGKNQE